MFYFHFSTTILSTFNFYFCRAQTNDRIVVTNISVVSVDSIFAPLTASGTIVVDNVEEKFPKENFRVSREMREEILVYDGLRPVFDEILSENGTEMQGKCCQILDFRV